MAHSRKRKRDLRLAELYDMLPQDLKTYLIDPDVYFYLHKMKFQFVLQQLLERKIRPRKYRHHHQPGFRALPFPHYVVNASLAISVPGPLVGICGYLFG